MAVTPPKVAELDFCLRHLIMALGIADPNYTDGSEVASAAPYSKVDLKTRLALADYEINSWIIQTLEHPYRTQFDTESTGPLGDQDLIPAHLGDHSHAEIADEEVPAVRAQSMAHLEKVRNHPTLYGDPAYLYFIHAGRVHLGDPTKEIIFYYPNVEPTNTDSSDQVRTFDDLDVLINASYIHSDTAAQDFGVEDIGRRLVIASAGIDGKILMLVSPTEGRSVNVIVGDTATSTQTSADGTLFDSADPILRAPYLYTWGIVANAVISCANAGFDVPHRSYWAQMLEKYEMMIRGRDLSLPRPDRLARLGT